MLMNSIKMQLRVIWERKVATTMFVILLALVLLNYFNNVFTYRGTDIVDMYHPMNLLTLTYYGEYSFYLMQYYPLIVVIPAAFSLYADKVSKQIIFIQSRVGARNYYLGKLIVVFLVTCFVFSVPFLVEIILNMIAFPTSATGNPSNIDEFQFFGLIKQYFLSDFYIFSPYLYSVFFTLVFGVFSGILAMLTVAISTFPIKFKVLLFLPVFIILNLLYYFKEIFPEIETNHYFYLRLFSLHINSTGSILFLSAIVFITLTVSLTIISHRIRKDLLL